MGYVRLSEMLSHQKRLPLAQVALSAVKLSARVGVVRELELCMKRSAPVDALAIARAGAGKLRRGSGNPWRHPNYLRRLIRNFNLRVAIRRGDPK
jgi:DNA-binding transcriptional regulator YdaS (Cro superfamily)